eukprot:334194-Ditylum_brightwellii.AAC.1
MEVVRDTMEELEEEGINEVKNLAEFTKGTWKQVVDNLKCPGDWTKNLDSRANKNHATVPQTLYLLGAKCRRDSLRLPS